MTLDYGIDFFNDVCAKADAYQRMRQHEVIRSDDDLADLRYNYRQSVLAKSQASIVGYRSDGTPIYKD